MINQKCFICLPMKCIFGLFLLVAFAQGNPLTSFFENAVQFVKNGLAGVADFIKNLAETIRKQIQDQCELNGGKGAYEALENSVVQWNVYYNAHFVGIRAKIEEAKKKGDLYDFFKKQCPLMAPMLEYSSKLGDALASCSANETRIRLQFVSESYSNIIRNFCYNNGERLASEGGMECIDENLNDLRNCLENLVNLEKEKCEVYQTSHECVVKTMAKCKKNTPHKIFEDNTPLCSNLTTPTTV